MTKLPITEFGDRLIQTRDLDPTYVGLHGAALGQDQLCRWLLAYWCFYHVGVACYLSEFEGGDYWDWMLRAAYNHEEQLPHHYGLPEGRWPRAAERRHFRGQKCADAVEWLRREFERPENPVKHLMIHPDWERTGMTDKKIMTYVRDWPMFGPWIAFKAADMLERCAGVPVKFDPDIALMYDEPRRALDILSEGAFEVADDGTGITTGIQPRDWDRRKWYDVLSMYFRKHLAPPARDRTCGPQEVETVLCKWKSYMGGHYHIGKDIHDHRGALAGWGSTAASMLAKMPEEVQG